MSLEKFLPSQGIKIKHAINKHVGKEMHPSAVDDHRKLTRFLDNRRDEFFTYRLPEDKTLRMVLIGIPLPVDVADIEGDLREKASVSIRLTDLVKRLLMAEMLTYI